MNSYVEKFWKSRKEYPPFIYDSQRKYLDLGIILKYIENIDSILDLGCGEGRILIMLRELTKIKTYYGYDLSPIFINNLINRWGNYPGLNTKIVNIIKETELPKTDLCVFMGVMPYILEDNLLKNVLVNIQSNLFITRISCTIGKKRAEIDKFSEEFKERYTAVYRTLSEYISILSEFFNIENIGRCYPDEIESKYGSKQFYFVCRRK